MPEGERPLRVVNSVAPIRVCDNGGWTDTWFARYGRIFNIAVYPYAEVQVEVFPRHDRPHVTIVAENFGERYVPKSSPEKTWDRHPLLEAAIARMSLPDDLAFRVSIYSEAPAGASTGTSAAVSVSLIGALDCLSPGRGGGRDAVRLSPYEVARTAHAVETEMLGLQCGIQDQLCSAFGGINLIDMAEYPHATVTPIIVPNPVWWELERRLALVYLGKSHSSSDVHKQVIAELENAGPEAPKLRPLRLTADRSRDALLAGDFAALGRTMIANTDAQADLHPALVSPDARRIIDIARSFGALGWKVNGAGGDGGSVTLLCPDLSFDKRAMIRAIEEANPLFRNIPTYLARQGLRTWETRPT